MEESSDGFRSSLQAFVRDEVIPGRVRVFYPQRVLDRDEQLRQITRDERVRRSEEGVSC